jgi:hypothetical protein
VLGAYFYLKLSFISSVPINSLILPRHCVLLVGKVGMDEHRVEASRRFTQGHSKGIPSSKIKTYIIQNRPIWTRIKGETQPKYIIGPKALQRTQAIHIYKRKHHHHRHLHPTSKINLGQYILFRTPQIFVEFIL